MSGTRRFVLLNATAIFVQATDLGQLDRLREQLSRDGWFGAAATVFLLTCWALSTTCGPIVDRFN